MEFPGDTLSALLRSLAARQPDREALVCPEFTAGASDGQLAVSCGGQAEGGEPSPSTSAGASGTGGSGSQTPRPGTALGECVLGFDPSVEPGRPCAWVADDLCYDTKPAACACSCPRNRNDSVCSSSFDDGPDGHVDVYCG